MARERADRQSGRLAGAPPEGERRPGLRAVGAAASRIAGPIVAQHGSGTLARLKAQWSAIVGPELAALTWPEALGRDGALKLRVAPGAALELQHRAHLAIERINLFFGRGIATRLVLLQAPLPLAGVVPPPPPTPLSIDDKNALDAGLAAIADPELRAALAGLGQLVLARRRGG